jgi:hypothetical protein
MRTTRTRTTDYTKMLMFVKSYIGKPAISAIDAFAENRRIVHHRAGKVFWSLVDEGLITCKRRCDGIEIIQTVEPRA